MTLIHTKEMPVSAVNTVATCCQLRLRKLRGLTVSKQRFVVTNVLFMIVNTQVVTFVGSHAGDLRTRKAPVAW